MYLHREVASECLPVLINYFPPRKQPSKPVGCLKVAISSSRNVTNTSVLLGKLAFFLYALFYMHKSFAKAPSQKDFVRVSIVIKSFDPKTSFSCKHLNTLNKKSGRTKVQKISTSNLVEPLKGFSLHGLLKRRTHYTVLRSPHIDKKSREQWWSLVHKNKLIMLCPQHRLREKLEILRNHRLQGSQLQVTFQQDVTLPT